MTRSDDLSPLDVEAVKVLIAHTRTDITGCHCGWGSHAGNMGQLHALHVWRELQRAVLPDHDARVRADERAKVAEIPGWAYSQDVTYDGDTYRFDCAWCRQPTAQILAGGGLEELLTVARDHHRTCAHRQAAAARHHTGEDT